MDDPKEGGLLTPKWCGRTTYRLYKRYYPLRCVFISAPWFYHTISGFSTRNKGHSNRHAPNFYNSNALSIFCYFSIYMALAPCNYYTNRESYLCFLNFSNITITSGCVGVNLIPRFNIPTTFLAFCSISLAVCSLVSIRWFPAIVYSRSMYSSVIGNISYIKNAPSRLSSSLTIWRMSQGFPAFSFFSIIRLYLPMRLDNGIIQYIPVLVSSKQ